MDDDDMDYVRTDTTCDQGDYAIYVARYDGSLAVLCPTCDTIGEPAVSPVAGMDVRHEAEFRLRAKRNMKVWMMSKVPRDQRTIDDPFGPGTSQYNRLSYDIAEIDHALFSMGAMV